MNHWKETQNYFNNNITAEQGRKILTKRLNNSLHFQVRSEITADEIDNKRIGIACLSENWNSLLMWSHYAENHKGYCTGFDEKWIRFCQKFENLNETNLTPSHPKHP